MGNHGKLILPAKTVGSIPQALLFLLGIVVLAAVPEGYGVKGKMIVDFHRPRSAKETASVYIRTEDNDGGGFCYPYGQADEPHKHLAGNEKPLR